MRVPIPIEFEVEPVDASDGELSEAQAEGAAEQAAFDYLSFCTVSGVNTDVQAVVVHVDGFGECTVQIKQGT